MTICSEESAPATPRVFRTNGEELDCNLSSVASGVEVYDLIAGELSCSTVSLALIRENGDLLPNNASAITLRPGEVLTLVVRSALAVCAMLLQERDELISQMRALCANVRGCESEARAISSLASKVMQEECISIARASSGIFSAEVVQILLQSELDETLEEMLSPRVEAIASANLAIDAALSPLTKNKCKQPAVSVGMPDLWLRLLETWKRLQDLRYQFGQSNRRVRQLCRDIVDRSKRLAETERHFHRMYPESSKEAHSDGTLMEDIDQLEVFCKHPYLDSFCCDPILVCDELLFGGIGVFTSYLYDESQWSWSLDFCCNPGAATAETINFHWDLGTINVETQDPWADKHAEQRWRRDLHLARQRTRLESSFSAARQSQPKAKGRVPSGQVAKQKKLPKKKGGRFKAGEHKLFEFQMRAGHV